MKPKWSRVGTGGLVADAAYAAFMTTLTGTTAMTLPGLPFRPPHFAVALGGSLAQCGLLLAVWARHSAELADFLRGDWTRYPQDAWARLCVSVFLFALFGVWPASIYPCVRGKAAHSDTSLVDRLWSLQPAWYCCYFLYCAGDAAAANLRLLLASALVALWAARLTWNFWRKGGFSGGEDYRWAEVRSWYPGWIRFELFNLCFICVYQQLLILAFTVPVVAVYQAPRVPLCWLDGLATLLFLLCWTGESVADAQMFAYQTEKYRRRAAGEPAGDYARGFIESGLWAYCRHPNYMCEVSLWWAFYLFSVAATGEMVNWTVVGPLLLTLLFVVPGGSMDVTEAISSRKYPAFPERIKTVNKFFPSLTLG
eukprot:g65020.t1